MERRRNERFPFEITLEIEELYKQDNVVIEDLNGVFQVVDLSKAGAGFLCGQELPLDFYFNAKITIDQDKHFYTVAKIIRTSEKEDGVYHYGCEFVGLADILSSVVDDLKG